MSVGLISSTDNPAPAALANIEQAEVANNVPLVNRVSVDSYATLLAYAALTGVGIKAYEPRFDYRDIFQDRAKSLAEFAIAQMV